MPGGDDRNGGTRHYHTLDGLRGLAAIMVVLFHSWIGLRAGLFTGGWLAVDFFLCLSGFVISFAYDARFAAGLGPGRFALVRVARLWPVVVAGALIGFALAPWSAYVVRCTAPPVWRADAMLGQLLLIPGIGNRCVFGYNNVFWSIFFELLLNVIHALLLWRLSGRAMLLAAAIVAAAMALLSGPVRGINFGMDPAGFWIGFVRCGLAYLLGCALFRYRDAAARWLGWVPFPVMAGLLVLALALPVPNVPALGPGAAELAYVLIFFPMLLASAVRAGSREGRMTRALKALGLASYPLYGIHLPVLFAARYWIVPLGLPEGLRDLIFVLLIAALVGLAWAFGKWIDGPLNRWRARAFAGGLRAG